MATKDKAQPWGSGVGLIKIVHCRANTRENSTGRYGWRRTRGLLTIGDLVQPYRAIRAPRGSYRTPLPDDRLPCWRYPE